MQKSFTNASFTRNMHYTNFLTIRTFFFKIKIVRIFTSCVKKAYTFTFKKYQDKYQLVFFDKSSISKKENTCSNFAHIETKKRRVKKIPFEP